MKKSTTGPQCISLLVYMIHGPVIDFCIPTPKDFVRNLSVSIFYMCDVLNHNYVYLKHCLVFTCFTLPREYNTMYSVHVLQLKINLINIVTSN